MVKIKPWLAAAIAAFSFNASLRPAAAQTTSYCRFDSDAIAEKESLRVAAVDGDSEARQRYNAILQKQAESLRRCREQTWPQTQAIWLRVYPCDARPGAMDALFDHIVNKGYNQVHVEVFFDAQVLLPANDNPTPWVSVVRSPGAENVDLLAMAIAKGRERGIKVYAWAFTMNFGYGYGLRPDREQVLARNGKGQTSISYVRDNTQTFIDPYNPQAQQDYQKLVQAIARRKPDGMLFDYIRYPRGAGSQSVAGNVKDLWIYGEASQQALQRRAFNGQASELIGRFLQQGFINANDLQAVRQLYPTETTPEWQGRNPMAGDTLPALQTQLWLLTVAHAAQGVVDFLNLAIRPLQSSNIPAGAVFFPDANKSVGQQGYDSRLQPWDRFPAGIEFHPMAYSICGSPSCNVEEIMRTISLAPPQAKVIPALAGYWGRRDGNRPSLEEQMNAIRQQIPSITALSHFAYSWQEPEIDQRRRSCQL
ncbi:family 10 glycosylhydrolase [Oscillatoria sp. FACHB-1406]|uniref:family 10 glycosylhydrolase n=1 Tax=Oscillatoria sp. FACHB-1406 TaxID=2692846 RepID=UPI001F5546A7|nr:family 10 glycosylhydrolase [Oscillatoria sp. FACHB-1406]